MRTALLALLLVLSLALVFAQDTGTSVSSSEPDNSTSVSESETESQSENETESESESESSSISHEESSTSSNSVEDHDDHQVNRRRFDIQINGNKVEIEGRSENQNFEDRLEIELETNSDSDRLFELEVRYRSETDQDAKNELRFRFRLESILEWLDASPFDGKFTSGEEVFTYTGPKSWGAWTQSSTSQKRRAGTTVYDFSAQTTDGVLRIVAHVATGPTTLYDANGIKFDLEINGFPFTDPNSDGLAFVTRLVTESRVENGDRDDEPSEEESSSSSSSSSASVSTGKREAGHQEEDIKITHDSILDRMGVLGRFVWVNSLDSANGTVAVHAGNPTKGDGNYELIFWVDEHRDDYLWDPSLRVEYTGSGSMLQSWLSYLF